HIGGQVARRMLPIAVSIPVLGYVAFLVERAGAYGPNASSVVEGVAGMVVAAATTLVVGQSLDRTDARRRDLEAESREWRRFFDESSFGAAFATPDGRLGLVNKAYARMHGYTAEQLEGRP